jgi:hypothetical protein
MSTHHGKDPSNAAEDLFLQYMQACKVTNTSFDTTASILYPLIDLFNHISDSTSACKVTHDNSGFTVTSQKAYTGDIDEEIYVSDGSHSNDFLLVEYGFLLPDGENKHDSISLDSIIMPTLCVEQKRLLKAKGYLGEYTLFSPAANGRAAGVCWRTEVVASIA